ncbi:MAG: hypothetical protein IJE04_05445 [Bacilli bacterium]|nr:hypothetical protein [Bacilli bacterium]
MLEIGEIVKLSNDKEYIVINAMNLHHIRYVFLISNFKPLDIVIGTEKIIDEDIVVEEVKDNNELDYVLSQFALSKDDEDEFDE